MSQARRFNILSAGRRWRKTTLLMAICMRQMMNRKELIWGAPTYDQVWTCWEESRRAGAGVVDFSVSHMEARLPNGGRILYRSLDDPQNARSKTADGVVIDEAGDVAEVAWYEVLRPMLIDTKGWAWVIGTPKGRNWFWREFQAARDRNDAIAWQAPTLGVEIRDGQLFRKPHPLENPHIEFDEILQAFKTTPERSFRQEYLAEFLEDGGSVFRFINEAKGARQQERAQSYHIYVIGCDWAQVDDFSVFTVIDCTMREVVTVDRSNHIDYLLQIDRLRALCERFQPDLVVSERTGNRALADFLRGATYRQVNKHGETVNSGLPLWDFDTTNESKSEIVQALALAFERREIKIPDETVIVSELEAFTSERLPSGKVRYSAPEGLHDDCVMSLALAWYSARRFPAVESLTADARLSRQMSALGWTPDRIAATADDPMSWFSRELHEARLRNSIKLERKYGQGQWDELEDRQEQREWGQGLGSPLGQLWEE